MSGWLVASMPVEASGMPPSSPPSSPPLQAATIERRAAATRRNDIEKKATESCTPPQRCVEKVSAKARNHARYRPLRDSSVERSGGVDDRVTRALAALRRARRDARGERCLSILEPLRRRSAPRR